MANDDSVEGVLGTEIAPASRPRDQGGKYIRESAKPEPMFAPRPVEGASNDEDVQARQTPARSERASDESRQPDRREGNRHAPTDDGHDDLEEIPENITSELSDDATDDEQQAVVERQADDEGQRVTVVVDGEEREVTLKEALDGYVRQETFHKRMNELHGIQTTMEADATRMQSAWAALVKVAKDYEDDLQGLIPPEPDWQALKRANPVAAIETRETYDALYKKLNDARNKRGLLENAQTEERDRQLQQYAVNGFARFVAKHPKTLNDEAALKKNLDSMRRTALAEGFSEQEVATVFDPRMLSILYKASKYDRIQAASKKAVVNPSRGRTLTPGSATPRLGNANRKGLDEAQKRLQASGRLDDAAAVFSEFLRG